MTTAILTKEESKTFIRIKNLIDTKKIDISTIARGVNKSASTISLYLSKKYTGRIDMLEADLDNYLKLFEESQKIEAKVMETVDTSILKRVFNAANMCQMRGKMGVCYGSPGIGKTTAILEYQKQNAGVIYVDPFEKTSARAVLEQIASQLRVNYYPTITMDAFCAGVIKKLEKNKCIIIVDEAENLRVDIFKILRKIHDRTRENCGMLFVGTEELSILLQKVKYGFPYISSRIGYIERLDRLKIDDVEKLVKQYFPNTKSAIINLMAKTGNYNARNIQNLMDLCLDIMQSNNIEELDADVIETAREKLLI
ncbi:ATP-binding protein [bacterium]|nr:ATP-binding protein [bacterium]